MIHKTPELIGMLHVPVNTILASPVAWRNALGLPATTVADWRLVDDMCDAVGWLMNADDEVHRRCFALTERLSFFPPLLERAQREAEVYIKHGIDALMLENTGAPYFVRDRQPAVIYWVMAAMVAAIRQRHPTRRIGMQILAFSDDWAMDIACRNRLDFIRAESALFEGVRPEGRTPNHGNLAQLYLARERVTALMAEPGVYPRVFLDIRKKHTLFPASLDTLDLWLENLAFCKVEGVILTGKRTGDAVLDDDFRKTRQAIDRLRTTPGFPQDAEIPLWIGSGAAPEQIPLYRECADGVIVGSFFKKDGYWENPLDEDRVRVFMEAWNP